MSETVIVTLNRRRPYRAQPSDRRAVWVGPGEVSVPRWVAEAWGMTPQAAPAQTQTQAPGAGDPAEPWPGYDAAGAAQIIQRAPDLTQTERARAAAYEQANKARSTVLDALFQHEEQQEG
jgi:hypothetical protein